MIEDVLDAGFGCHLFGVVFHIIGQNRQLIHELSCGSFCFYNGKSRTSLGLLAGQKLVGNKGKTLVFHRPLFT